MRKPDNLKRVIVDFKKLTPEILKLLVDKYPDGYDEDHIIEFRNVKKVYINIKKSNLFTIKIMIKKKCFIL